MPLLLIVQMALFILWFTPPMADVSARLIFLPTMVLVLVWSWYILAFGAIASFIVRQRTNW